MSQVISFRLDANNPREAEALRVLVRSQEQGYSVRHILTEALLKFERADTEQQVQKHLEQILVAMEQITDLLERQHEIRSVDGHEQQQASLSNAFVVSIKSAAKRGFTLEG